MNRNLPSNPEQAAHAVEDLAESLNITRVEWCTAKAAAADSVELADRARRVFFVERYGQLRWDIQDLIEACHAYLVTTSGRYDDQHGQGSSTIDVETRWTAVWAWALEQERRAA